MNSRGGASSSERNAATKELARFRETARADDTNWLDEYADYSAIKQHHNHREEILHGSVTWQSSQLRCY